MHLGVMAALAGQSPVLVVGVEKMWTGDRGRPSPASRTGLPADERAELRVRLDNDAGSVLMGAERPVGPAPDRGPRAPPSSQIAAAAAKARRCGSRNPWPSSGRRSPSRRCSARPPWWPAAHPADVLVVHRRRRRRGADGRHRPGAPRGSGPACCGRATASSTTTTGCRDRRGGLEGRPGSGRPTWTWSSSTTPPAPRRSTPSNRSGSSPPGEAGAATAGRATPTSDGAGRVREPERRPRGPGPSARGHRALPDRRARRTSCGAGPAGRQVHGRPARPRPSTPAGSSAADTALVGRPRPRAGLTGAWRRHHRVGHRRPRQDRHQRGPLGPPRHERRLDHRAHRDHAAAHRGDHLRAGHRGRGGQALARRRAEPPRTSTCSCSPPPPPTPSVPGTSATVQDGARDCGRGLRPQRGVLGLRLRAGGRPRDGAGREPGGCSSSAARPCRGSPTGTTGRMAVLVGDGAGAVRPRGDRRARASCWPGTWAPTASLRHLLKCDTAATST